MQRTSHLCADSCASSDPASAMSATEKFSTLVRPSAGGKWTFLRYLFPALAVLVIALFLYRTFFDGSLLRPYHDSLAQGDISDWRMYGGQWGVSEGRLENLSGARGDKAVIGSPRWADYVVETDIRLNADPVDSLWGDAGVILRVTDPAIGVDAYDGYYVGIGSEGSVLLLGRANYSWMRLGAVPLASPARKGSWFHLRALVKGCYFEASARELPGGTQTQLTYFDRDCPKRSGSAGVRTFGLPASWRNFTVHRPES